MKLPFKQLTSFKSGTLGSFALGVFYLIFPWFTQGALDPLMSIFGLMFLTIAFMRAKGSNTVIGGLCQSFIGIMYVFAVGGVISIDNLWILSIVCTALFFILELGFVKLGPTTKRSDAFQIVPLTLMTFVLLLSIIGYTSIFVIDMNNLMVTGNYIAVFLFCALSMLQLAGWNIAGKNTNKWITIFAVAAIALAFIGTYQGTLFQWR